MKMPDLEQRSVAVWQWIWRSLFSNSSPAESACILLSNSVGAQHACPIICWKMSPPPFFKANPGLTVLAFSPRSGDKFSVPCRKRKAIFFRHKNIKETEEETFLCLWAQTCASYTFCKPAQVVLNEKRRTLKCCQGNSQAPPGSDLAGLIEKNQGRGRKFSRTTIEI